MKTIKIVSCLLICILISGCGNSKTKSQAEQKNDYIEQITTLTQKIVELSNENAKLTEELSNEELDSTVSGDCAFTRTYNVVDIMKYQTSDNDSKFIILDQFQSVEPFVVNLKNDQAAILTKGDNFEFSFSGEKKYHKSEYTNLFKNFKLDNIKQTDKIGLDQVQDSCR
ncbi:MAG: hypothetical protein WDA12_02090 [Bacilli bacterium]